MELEITSDIAAETIAVLENTEISLLAKIPLKLITALQAKADEGNTKFNLDFSKPYGEQTISEETRAVMALIYREYWCTEEERAEFDKRSEQAQIKLDEELREKYNPDKIFEKAPEPVKQENIQAEVQNDISVIEEQSWFAKIINKIKNLFKKG